LNKHRLFFRHAPLHFASVQQLQLDFSESVNQPLQRHDTKGRDLCAHVELGQMKQTHVIFFQQFNFLPRDCLKSSLTTVHVRNKLAVESVQSQTATMFLNTIYSDGMKVECKANIFRRSLHRNVEILRMQSNSSEEYLEIPRFGPYNTGIKSMEYALSMLLYLYGPVLGGYFKSRNKFTNFVLTLFYQSVAEIIQEKRLNGNGMDIMRRVLLILKQMHCMHYADTFIESQWHSIFQRRLAVAIACHPRLGRFAGIAKMDGRL